MSYRFDGRWRWAIAAAVFTAVMIGQTLPADWHLLIRTGIVGLVTLAILLLATAIRTVVERRHHA